MPDYRAYIVGPDGRFMAAEVIVAKGDAEALLIAKQFVDGHDVELASRPENRRPSQGREMMGLWLNDMPSVTCTLRRGGDSMTGKEELYRRLEQSRRLVAHPLDPLTRERINGLISVLEQQVAAIEARDADAPPD